MKSIAFRIASVGLTGLAVSGCTFPVFEDATEAQVVQPARVAPVAQAAVAPAPAAAPQPVVTAAPTSNTWGHKRSGLTVKPEDGDEDGGWSG